MAGVSSDERGLQRASPLHQGTKPSIICGNLTVGTGRGEGHAEPRNSSRCKPATELSKKGCSQGSRSQGPVHQRHPGAFAAEDSYQEATSRRPALKRTGGGSPQSSGWTTARAGTAVFTCLGDALWSARSTKNDRLGRSGARRVALPRRVVSHQCRLCRPRYPAPGRRPHLQEGQGQMVVRAG